MAVAVAALGGTGCRMVPSHLHSKADEETMKKAKEAMDAVNTGAPGIYTAMQKNVELFAKEENRVLQEFADVAGQGSIAYDSSSKAKNVLKDLIGTEAEKDKAGKINIFITRTLPDAVEKMDGLTREQKAAIESTKNPLKVLGEAIDKKKEEINVYNSSVALLRTAIIEFPELKKGASSALQEKEAWEIVRGAGKAVGAFAGAEVTYVDADGKSQTKKASQVASVAYKFIGLGGKEPMAWPDAPGIDLIVLNASLGLLELKRDVAKTELQYLDQARVVLGDAYTRAILARELARDSRLVLSEYDASWPNNFSTLTEGKVREAQEMLKGKADIQGRHRFIREHFIAVRKLAVAQSSFARSQALLEVALARLDHSRSIAISAVNDAGRRALVTRAIEGLQVYHSSGFTPEHLAQIAQVVALGAIALQL